LAQRSPLSSSIARLAITLAAALVAGCNGDDAPSGQVIATVDGEEITVAELNEEARTRNLPIGSNAVVHNALVQELIDRKLLRREAERLGLDRRPEHLLSVRRLAEISLAQRLLAQHKSGEGLSDQQLQAFVSARPWAFADRKLFSVDRVRVPVSDQKLAAAMRGAGSLERMVQIAQAARHSPDRATESWDSASLPQGLRAAVNPLAPGAMFVVQEADRLVAGKLLGTSPQPVPADQRIALARSMIVQSVTEQRLQQLSAELRAKSKIRIQPAPEK
jgi:EpsD family peptidyl-prolyl cis-trans isomerase